MQKDKKFVKKTQERQETQETHRIIFCIYLVSFTLGKRKSKNQKVTETHERHETYEIRIWIHRTHTVPVIRHSPWFDKFILSVVEGLTTSQSFFIRHFLLIF